MVSKIYQISDDDFRAIVASSNTYSDCLRKLNLSTDGGGSRTALKRRIQELDCDVSHFIGCYPSQSSHTYTLEEILVENSTYTNREQLKRRLVRAGLLEYKCSCCGLVSWIHGPLSLHLEHINGVNNDNRLENLTLLCPNCHSQTPTYAGRNTTQTRQMRHAHAETLKQPKMPRPPKEKKVKEKKVPKPRPRKVPLPSKVVLYELLLNQPFTKVAEMFGVTDNAVRKWCKSYGIPYKSSEYKQLKQQNVE